MTEDNRAFLEGRIALVRYEWRDDLSLFLSLAAFGLVIAGVLLFLLRQIASHAGYRLGNRALFDEPALLSGAIAIVSVVGGCLLSVALCDVAKRRRWARTRREAIAADVAAGTARDEVFEISDAEALREEEHGMFIFFLHLSNGRVLVLCDYDSVDGDNDFPEDNAPAPVPTERLSMVTYPRSGARRWAFQGAAVPFTRGIMARGPEDWPEHEDWARVKWQNIEKHYGRKVGS